MENKHIILILLVVIAVLAVAIGVVLMNPANPKDPSIVKITSEKKQSEEGDLAIRLTDLSENPISKEIVNVTITDKNGKVVVDDVVKTDSKGKAKLGFDLKKGKYDVYVDFAGNDNFTGDNATQKLTIKKEAVAESQSSSSSSSSSQSQPSVYAYKSDGTPMYSQAEVDSYMYNKYGPVNYHIKSNRYIDLDEPGFDDKGNWIGY